MRSVSAVSTPDVGREVAPRGGARRRRIEATTGWLYAAPTALFVVALFVLPLLLVLQMSASDWPLLSGNQGTNLPANYEDAVQNRFFKDCPGLHPQVHRARHYPAHRPRSRAGAARAGDLPLELVPAHVLPAPERARTRLGEPALLRALLAVRGPVRRPDPQAGVHVPRHPDGCAVVDAVPHRLALRRLLHAAHARRPAGNLRATSSKRPGSTGPRAGRSSGGSPSRCCAPPWR